MKISIITTATDPIPRMDPYDEAMACYADLADEVIVTGQDWPEEFTWDHIGKTFQQGYAQATGDWVIRMDLDYFFHEKDMDRIRTMLEMAKEAPALSFWKYQFLLVDRYQIKSRPIIAMNKGKFGDQIKLEGGGDLCQPTLDGKELIASKLPEMRIPIYNYDFSFKTEEVIANDFSRFTRAWYRTFGDWPFGGQTPEEAFEGFKKMMAGRYKGSDHKQIPLDQHPKYIRERIENMESNQFGHSMFGWTDQKARYFA